MDIKRLISELKSRENAVATIEKDLYNPPSGLTWTLCGKCEREIDKDFNFCPECGTKIKTPLTTFKRKEFEQLLAFVIGFRGEVFKEEKGNQLSAISGLSDDELEETIRNKMSLV